MTLMSNRHWATASLVLLLLLAACPGLSAATLDEDVEFGCALVRQRYYVLGIDVLTARVGELKTVSQKSRVFDALEAAHAFLSRRCRDVSPEEEKRRREQHLKAAEEYRELLAKIPIPEGAETLPELTQLVVQAMRVQRDKKHSERALHFFEAAIKGMERLTREAGTALDRHLETEPEDFDSAAYKKWERRAQDLEEPHMRAGVDLNRTRYWYAKALPDSRSQERQKLIEQAAEGLDRFCSDYELWLHTILGREILAKAYLDLRKFPEAAEACEPGLDLIKQAIEQTARTENLIRVRDNLLGSWALAMAKQEQFDTAAARVKNVKTPGAQLAYAEVLLMKAQHLAKRKGSESRARTAKKHGESVLRRVAAIDEYWQDRVEAVLPKYDPASSSYIVLMARRDDALRRGDNAAAIASSKKLLALGQKLPEAKRAVVLKGLAGAYRQERMYYEAYTVYSYLATSGIDKEAADRYAEQAVRSLRNQYELTRDPADRVCYDAARRWGRDKFNWPGAEFERGTEHRAQGRYMDAVAQFERVPEASFYCQSALSQIGVCYVLQALKLQKSDPAESAKFLEQGRTALLRFLEKTREPSPFPRVMTLRKRDTASAIYRLGTVYMWPGKEDHKACLTITADYARKFPDAVALHPYVSLLRVRALLALGDVAKAEVALAALRTACVKMTDKARSGKLLTFATDLVFNGYDKLADEKRKAAEQKELQGRAQEAEQLRNEAGRAANKALNVVTAAITADPNAPYERIYYVIDALERQKRYNELSHYVELFLKRFGDKKGLSPKYGEQVDNAWLLLGIARYHSGRYEAAYRGLVERAKVLDTAFKKRKQSHPEARLDPQYWPVQLYIARSARELAKASGKEEYARSAKQAFSELWRNLRKETDDWWDVTVSLLEVQNVMGQYDDSLLAIRRHLATREDLGGPKFRARFVRVLEEIIKSAKEEPTRTEAEALLKRLKD